MANPFGFVGGPMGPMSGPMATPGQMGTGQMAMAPQMPPLPPPPPPGNMIDPAQNNQPLQFNMSKGKPPMPIPGPKSPPLGPSPDMARQRSSDSLGELPKDGHNGQPQQVPPQQQATVPTSGDGSMMGPMGMMAPWGPMMGPMMGDPSMMMAPMGYGPMGFMGPMGPMGPGMEQRPKEILTLKSMTLYPPPPSAPPQSTRERPPGCRTIFIGGLPENMTEDLVREIFEDCGGVCSIRMSKKNFAHIRYEGEECVDKALFFSGYRVKIENKDDKANTGRLHVDFAQARDDLYEWECKQRALAREHRHRQRLEEERLRPPSPPPIIHYSDHEASLLHDNLKAEDSFSKACQVLMTWLERGDCNRRTANSFYSMVQSVNSHVRRLMNDKAAHDEEFEAVKKQFRDRLEGILRQFEQIEKVFTAASKQKAWDHFSKAQRKNLDLWRKQCQEIKSNQEQEFLQDRQEAEMEMSDSEDTDMDGPSAAKRLRAAVASAANLALMAPMASQDMGAAVLKEENDNLKCQLEAYKNEVDILRSESRDTTDEKDRQIKALQQALQGMQRQLMDAKAQIKEEEDETRKLQEKLDAKSDGSGGSGGGSAESREGKEGSPVAGGAAVAAVAIVSSSGAEALSEREARLIALVSTFLHVHPFGASVDYIWSYLQQAGIRIRTSEIEDLLEKLPGVYKQDIMGVGASIEKRWKFIGFNS